MKSAETETEARVGLSVVNGETGEITEGECSLEDFNRLPDIIAAKEQLKLFDGEQVRVLSFNAKTYKGIHFNKPEALKIGDEVRLACRAKVVEVKAYRDPEIGLVREHTLRLMDVHD